MRLPPKIAPVAFNPYVIGLVSAKLGPETADAPILHLRVGSNYPSSAMIDTGPINALYLHTWALDLSKGLSDFEPVPAKSGPLLHLGDRLELIDACGNVLGDLAKQAKVDLRRHQCAIDGSRPTKRVYLELETSADRAARRLQLKHIRVPKYRRYLDNAFLVTDSINYTTTGEFVDHVASELDVRPPWHQGNQNANGPVVPPRREEGWRLLSQGTTDRTAEFLSLVYYNELEGRLRFYLLNRSLPTTATAYELITSLQGATGSRRDGVPAFEQLEGAFFPTDMRPATWSKGEITIPSWPRGTWVAVDMPFLYPMARNLPLASGSGSASADDVAAPLSPLYERLLAEGRRNVKLELTIRWGLEADVQLELIGEAVGQAEQVFGSQDSMARSMKDIWSSVKTGADWYGGIQKFGGELLSAFNKKGVTKVAAPSVGGCLACPSNPSSGPLRGIAMAGALFGYGMELFSLAGHTPEPMRMSLELALRGEIFGTTTTQLQQSSNWLYLPGRFSIKQAFDPRYGDGLPAGDIAYIDSLLPRYQRPMGLFGFRRDPSTARVAAYRNTWATSSGPYTDLHLTLDVATSSTPFNLAYRLGRTTHPPMPPNAQIELLPIVRNPHAPIAHIYPTGLTPQDSRAKVALLLHEKLARQWDYSAFEAHDDYSTSCPKASDITLLVSEPHVPLTVDRHDATLAGQYRPFGSAAVVAEQFVDEHGNVPVRVAEPLAPLPCYFDGKAASALDPFPIHDVMAYWDVRYRVEHRDGSLSDRTAQLRAPISMYLWDKDQAQMRTIPSLVLQPTPGLP